MKNIKIIYVGFFLLAFSFLSNTLELREYEKLWQQKGRDKKGLDEFAGWWGNENAISRILTRLHVIQKEYKSLLDIGCGFCTDYDVFKKCCPDITYLGIDITPLFISMALERGVPVQEGRVQDIPCRDSSFDVVYVRHLLEHLDSYQVAIKEMVRVAKQEVLIVFFIKPQSAATDRITFIDVGGLPIYQNRYSKAKIEAFLKRLDKVKDFSWQDVKNKEECILHILV